MNQRSETKQRVIEKRMKLGIHKREPTSQKKLNFLMHRSRMSARQDSARTSFDDLDEQ